MKLTQIALAVTALVAAPAFAASGSLATLYAVGGATTPADPVERIVYISGASALSGSLASVVGVATVCDGGTASVVELKLSTTPGGTDAGSTSDGRVVVCTTKSPGGSPFAKPFAVIKRDTNGSFDGVGPVISQSSLTKWAAKLDCDSTTKKCNIDTTSLIKPHAGLTDVDYAVWKGLSITGALSVPVPNLGTTVKNGGFAGQGFGVMVSEKLYTAMAVKQMAEGRLPAVAGGVACGGTNYTAGACQPSISKEEYAAIVDSQNYAYVANGALTPAGDTSVINLCRRVETSGTQASSNVYFLNNSCGNANPTKGFKNPKKAGDSGGPVSVFDSGSGDTVTGNYDDFGGAFGLFEGSGTGDARNCVIRRNTDADSDGNGLNPNSVSDALGTYAIGWISLENAPASGWKLIKLDGISPNAVQVPTVAGVYPTGDPDSVLDGWTADTLQRTNVVNGYYDAAPELEMLWPSNINSISGFGGTSASTFLGQLKTAFGTPSLVSPFKGIFVANGNGGARHDANPTVTHKGTRGGSFCAPQALAE